MAQSPFDDSDDTSCSSSASYCSTTDSDTDTESDESTSYDEPLLLRRRMPRVVHVVNHNVVSVCYNVRYARWMHDAYQERVRAEIAAFRAWCHWQYVYERTIVYDYLHVSQPPWVVAWRDSKSLEPSYSSFPDSYSLQSSDSSLQPIVHMSSSIWKFVVSTERLQRFLLHYRLDSETFIPA